jgi:hypothetical protein
MDKHQNKRLIAALHDGADLKFHIECVPVALHEILGFRFCSFHANKHVFAPGIEFHDFSDTGEICRRGIRGRGLSRRRSPG